MGIAAVLVLAGIVDGAVYGWTKLHPRPMRIPAISVLVDPRSAQLTQSRPALTTALNLPIQLVLILRASPDQSDLEVSGVRRTTVFTEVTCDSWTSVTRLSALFRVTDGHSTRTARAQYGHRSHHPGAPLPTRS